MDIKKYINTLGEQAYASSRTIAAATTNMKKTALKTITKTITETYLQRLRKQLRKRQRKHSENDYQNDDDYE